MGLKFLNIFKSDKGKKDSDPKPSLKVDAPESKDTVKPTKSTASVAQSVKSATKDLGYKITHQDTPNTMFIDKNKVSVNTMPNSMSTGTNAQSPALSTTSIR